VSKPSESKLRVAVRYVFVPGLISGAKVDLANARWSFPTIWRSRLVLLKMSPAADFRSSDGLPRATLAAIAACFAKAQQARVHPFLLGLTTQ
jgi:hypothetical protein